jgi:hypothetical protein
MEAGKVVLEVRATMLFLFLRRLGLDRGDGLEEVTNQAVVDAAITEADSRFPGGIQRQHGDPQQPADAAAVCPRLPPGAICRRPTSPRRLRHCGAWTAPPFLLSK